MQNQRRNFSGRKSGSFLEESNLKEKLQKSVSCAENQAILQKIVEKKRKQQNFLDKHRSM